MTVYIANDHGGYELKKKIMVHLQKKRIWVVNEGSDSTDIVRYPYYASRVASAVHKRLAPFGILICSTGIGMSMIANKYKGVRAALVDSVETAVLTRQHNDANILCLGGKITDDETAIKIVDAFLNTEYIGARHDISLSLIKKAEDINFCGGCYDEFDAEKQYYREDFYSNISSSCANILLDTDMLTDCDDVAALGMLLNFERRKKARILGVTVSSRYPASAAVVDAVNTYYGRGDIPVGAPKNGTGAYRDDSCFLDIISKEFPHKIKGNDDAPDAVSVMRKALAESADNSVKIVTIGYLTNLAGLMKSSADNISPLCGMELIDKKVCEWICMGGNFPDDPAIDNVNFTRDSEPALYCIRNYRGKITFVGRDIGHNIFFGEELHNARQDNIIRRAYQLHRGRYGDNWDHHTADPSTVLYAVCGLCEHFEAQSGSMTIYDDCSFTWDPETPSNMSYLLQKGDRKNTAKDISKAILYNQ